jgi:hypothetical protein
VVGRVRRGVDGFQDLPIEADPGMVFLVVTVSLEKLRPGPQGVPTTGVELHGAGRVRRPDGFGQGGRYCLHCRLQNRTTDHVVQLGFVFEIPRRESSKRHVLLFG